MSFKKIKAIEIENVLAKVSRQYLVGNLSRPQEIEYINDSNLEVGISAYNEFTIEHSHKHSLTCEYQYVLSGYTEYMDVDTMEIHKFSQGDFYFIPTNTSYAQKSAAGTKILFIKVPSLNDKVLLDESQTVKDWFNEKV